MTLNNPMFVATFRIVEENLGNPILDSDLYKINMSVLNEPRLAENIKFKNIVARLKSFYILSEKFRAVGPTP